MSTRLSASLAPAAATFLRFPAGARKRSKNCKRGTLPFSFPPPPTSLHSQISAAASHPRVGDTVYGGGQRCGSFSAPASEWGEFGDLEALLEVMLGARSVAGLG